MKTAAAGELPVLHRATAALAVLVPLAMGASFLLLTVSFDYPKILSLPPEDVLARLAAMDAWARGGWLGVTLSAVGLAVLALLMHWVMLPLGQQSAGGAFLPVYTACGVLAALAMALDLSQWVATYPWLGSAFQEAPAQSPVRAAALVTFEALHRLVGTGIGVYLATACSAAWALGLGRMMLSGSTRLPGWAALAAGTLFAASIFPGAGFAVYSVLNSMGFAAWTLWLLGSALLLARGRWPTGAPLPVRQ